MLTRAEGWIQVLPPGDAFELYQKNIIGNETEQLDPQLPESIAPTMLYLVIELEKTQT